MSNSTLTVALVSEVFWQADGPARLTDRLKEAADGGPIWRFCPSCCLTVADGDQGRRRR